MRGQDRRANPRDRRREHARRVDRLKNLFRIERHAIALCDEIVDLDLLARLLGIPRRKNACSEDLLDTDRLVIL